MTETIDETEIFEQLNATKSARGFFIAAVEVFNHSIDALIQRVFRKDDFAVQSVVEPLLNDSGPLGNISVRIKLLFGLGMLPGSIYHDIDDFIKLKHQLSQDAKEYQFTDKELLQWIKNLNMSGKLGLVLQQSSIAVETGDNEFAQMQDVRQQQRIKSGLSLAIVEICSQLDKTTPL